jgi:hypothetical protein
MVARLRWNPHPIEQGDAAGSLTFCDDASFTSELQDLLIDLTVGDHHVEVGGVDVCFGIHLLSLP